VRLAWDGDEVLLRRLLEVVRWRHREPTAEQLRRSYVLQPVLRDRRSRKRRSST
jgi:hypothetical protein